MKIRELTQMEKGELEKILDKKRVKQIQLRFDIASKQLKNNRELRNTRRDIARIKTILKEMA